LGGKQMQLWASLSDAGAWLAPVAALAVTACVATVLLLRDQVRLEQHALSLEAQIERLQDKVWQLAESEDHYRSLIEAQIDIIVQHDAQGRIVFANEGYAQLVGEPRRCLMGAAMRPKVVETRAMQTRPDGTRLYDEAIDTAEGIRWIAWIETMARAPGGAPALLRMGREVTERVISERAVEEARAKAEAASEAKSRFLATVSHEFRTPLYGILGMADLILDTPLTSEQTTYAHAIKTSGDAFLALIDEILDFSKIEAGRIDIIAKPFDIRALVQGMVELLAPKAQGKGIEISAYVARDVPRYVVGDGDRLRQVLVNLAGNAVKFTELGGVGVVVARGAADQIVIAVRDTGPGIPADRISVIFEEFEQGDGSPSQRHGGAGLGLAITRRIVEGMQGSIAVESQIRRGSTFSVTLPLPDAGMSDNEEEDIGSVAAKRILVVARSAFEAPFLVRHLESAGALVMQVDTAVDALAKIATSRWDAVLVDYRLGDHPVREIAKEARLAGVERSIVLLSPFERRDFGSPSAAGFDTYLVKPVRLRSLFERLTKSLQQRPKAAAPRRPRTRGVLREKSPPGARVLLAEDNEINALLALKALEKLGAVVDWAKDGQEALALAEASFSGVRPAYDLVLMDIRMPGLDGHEATRRIRKLERALGRTSPCRIIALTANALREDEQAARDAGVDGFLAKPFEFEALNRLFYEGRDPLARAS
jgi:PAS domain S-box-containing protein